MCSRQASTVVVLASALLTSCTYLISTIGKSESSLFFRKQRADVVKQLGQPVASEPLAVALSRSELLRDIQVIMGDFCEVPGDPMRYTYNKPCSNPSWAQKNVILKETYHYEGRVYPYDRAEELVGGSGMLLFIPEVVGMPKMAAEVAATADDLNIFEVWFDQADNVVAYTRTIVDQDGDNDPGNPHQKPRRR